MTTPALIADSLALSYRTTRVVHDVSIALRPGAVTALIGPNGSGKSTVLRSIAKLHSIDSGSIELAVHGAQPRDTTLVSPRDFAKQLAMLSQSRPHPSGLEVRDVVAFGRHPHRARFAPLSVADVAAIDRALHLTGLADMPQRAVDELSGGELQRVWLATALAQDTAVLLLDEPTNHLDLRYQVETLDLIRELADEHGTAIGVVLHDLDHAASVADDVVLLNHGRVHAVGSPAEVLTTTNLSEVYGLRIDAAVDPETQLVRITPRGKHHERRTSRQPEYK